MNVSHETIYTAIYAVPLGELRRQLVALLRQGRGARKPRVRGKVRRGAFQVMVSIHVRPPEIGDRIIRDDDQRIWRSVASRAWSVASGPWAR